VRIGSGSKPKGMRVAGNSRSCGKEEDQGCTSSGGKKKGANQSPPGGKRGVATSTGEVNRDKGSKGVRSKSYSASRKPPKLSIVENHRRGRKKNH